MTFLSTFGIIPTHRGDTVAPCELVLSDLSIVVPVKNNQGGVDRLLEACLKVFTPPYCPAEILLVDNLSHPPLEVPSQTASYLPVRVLVCAQSGAAAARNLGAWQVRTRWVLFLDNDCISTPGLIEGYRRALNGAIAYAGVVQAERNDPLSRYYDAQGILRPLPVWDQGVERPAYLITANALVWREALAQIGGFDERFPSAAGVIWRKICQGETESMGKAYQAFLFTSSVYPRSTQLPIALREAAHVIRQWLLSPCSIPIFTDIDNNTPRGIH